MFDHEFRHSLQPLGRAVQVFQRNANVLRRLQSGFVASSCLRDLGLGLLCAGLVNREFYDARLVVDRHRSAIRHGLPDVIYISVLAENIPRDAVARNQRRPREADERGIG